MTRASDENVETCKQIANEIEAYMDNENYRCPICGEIISWEDDNYNGERDEYACRHCHSSFDKDDMKQASIYEYLSRSVYDIEYRINGNRQYLSVELMIAGGGPSIYIDTGEKAVKLYWWFEKADYPLSAEACNAIDDYFEELYTA